MAEKKYQLPGMLPGGALFHDWQQESAATPDTAHKVGLGLRALGATPGVVAADIVQGTGEMVRPAFEGVMRTADAFLGYPGRGRAAPPPATANAVTAAAAQAQPSPSSRPVDYDDARPDQVLSSHTLQGPVSGRAPNASVPYPGQSNQSPADRAASYLPSMPQINFNTMPQGGYGGQNPGMINPNVLAQISSLTDEARPLLSSGGIVDRLRGRQLMKARARMIEGATSMANAESQGTNAAANMMQSQTGAFKASNEVPLALLTSATSRYGTDAQARSAANQTDAYRRASELQAATTQRGDELRLLPQMGSVYAGEEIGKEFAAGNPQGAFDIMRGSKYEPTPRNPPQPIPNGQGGYLVPDPTKPGEWVDWAELQKRRRQEQGVPGALPR